MLTICTLRVGHVHRESEDVLSNVVPWDHRDPRALHIWKGMRHTKGIHVPSEQRVKGQIVNVWFHISVLVFTILGYSVAPASGKVWLPAPYLRIVCLCLTTKLAFRSSRWVPQLRVIPKPRVVVHIVIQRLTSHNCVFACSFFQVPVGLRLTRCPQYHRRPVQIHQPQHRLCQPPEWQQSQSTKPGKTTPFGMGRKDEPRHRFHRSH